MVWSGRCHRHLPTIALQHRHILIKFFVGTIEIIVPTSQVVLSKAKDLLNVALCLGMEILRAKRRAQDDVPGFIARNFKHEYFE